jgi:outer membrane receptor protein involved in Fe transport
VLVVVLHVSTGAGSGGTFVYALDPCPSLSTRVHVEIDQGAFDRLVEKVKVTGSRVIDLDSETGSTVIGKEFFEDLPVFGHTYQAALTLAPGVNDANGDGNPNVHGGRERDFHMAVDGVSNVDPLTGTYMSNIDPDAIEEIELVTTGASAEFGRGQSFGKITKQEGTPSR